jgi:hypothetical protein
MPASLCKSTESIVNEFPGIRRLFQQFPKLEPEEQDKPRKRKREIMASGASLKFFEIF